MNQERYVAAIEISSSKIIASVGKMHPDGRLDIIASEQERAIESVRYGIIQNLDETSKRVTRVLDRLQLKPAIAPRVISSVFVGLSGRSLRSIRTEVDLSLPDETEISEEILQRLRKQALSTAIDSSLEVVDAVPRVYYVGKNETRSPKGVLGNSIRAVFDLIVCRPEMRRTLTRTLEDKIGISIAGFVVTALSTAQVILTSEEKRLGCMLLDMGAETTTVSIYKDGSLRYFATLPLGGRNITRDVTSLSLLEERAEELKITMGNAIARETPSTIDLDGIRMSEVSNLIVARSEEIVANIIEQLKYAGMKDKDLPVGIICIGGGTRLNGMIDLLSRQIGLSVRRGTLPNYITVNDTKASSAEMLQVASVLYSGAIDTDIECLESPGAKDLPVTGMGNDPEDEPTEETKRPSKGPKSGGMWSKFQRRISEIFSNADEDDSDLLE